MATVRRRAVSIAGLAGLYDATETSFSDAGSVNARQVVAANPNRYSLGFSLTLTGGADRVSTKPRAGVNEGLALVVGVFVQLTVQVWGPLVFAPWFFSSSAGPWNLTVFELEQV